MFQVTAPRAEVITEMGHPLLPAMGVTTVMNFQATADGKAAITGDFVLIDKEVNPVARVLQQHGIDVDTPRRRFPGTESGFGSHEQSKVMGGAPS